MSTLPEQPSNSSQAKHNIKEDLLRPTLLLDGLSDQRTTPRKAKKIQFNP